jgi:hypothetical protein
VSEAGHRLIGAVEGRRIVIEQESRTSAPGWMPLNPAGTRLCSDDLCRPVVLGEPFG